MNREKLAWAGGFFSGEGSTHVHTNAYVRKDGRQRKYLTMSITNTNLDALKQFDEATLHIGKVYIELPTKRPSHYKPRYQWTAKSYPATMAIIGLLYTFLSREKKDQIKRVIKDCHGW
jgi:hypothetical protein